MTFHEMKAALRNYPAWTKKLESIKAEIDAAKEQAQALREVNSIQIGGNPPSKNISLSNPTQAKAMAILVHYENRIAYLLEEHAAIMHKQQQLIDAIWDLPREEYDIIEARYIDGIHWDYLPAAVNMSRRTCFNIHDRAIQRLIRNLGK
jgi:DNA-directed RNA polymerase specialized sigma subunit